MKKMVWNIDFFLNVRFENGNVWALSFPFREVESVLGSFDVTPHLLEGLMALLLSQRVGDDDEPPALKERQVFLRLLAREADHESFLVQRHLPDHRKIFLLLLQHSNPLT